jgi:hypothetical protein
MRKKRLTHRVVLIGALLIAVLGIWSIQLPNTEGVFPSAPSQVEASEQGALPPAEPQMAAQGKESLREALRDTVEEAKAPAMVEASSAPGHRVRGTLTLTDCVGQEIKDLDGRFTVYTREDGERRELEVEIQRGEFEFALSDPSSLYVSDLFIEGRDVALEWSPETMNLLGAKTLTLKAREQCEVRLVVRDAGSGAHLNGLEIWANYDIDNLQMLIPSFDELIAEDAASPYTLPEVDLGWGSERLYWVRAEGYGWKKALVDHMGTGEYVVDLRPGAGLTVIVEELVGGSLNGHNPCLSLWSVETEEVVANWCEAPPFTHRWEGVPPGHYRALYTLDWYSGDSPILGSGEISLQAGDVAIVTIEPVLPELPFGPVSVSGTVRAGEYWREKGFSLKFIPLGETERWATERARLYLRDLAPDPSDPDLFRWSATLSCEGSWQVLVLPCRVHEDFDISASGIENIELSIEDPAELSILLKDAQTGEILPSAAITFEFVGRSRIQGIAHPPHLFDAATSRHRVGVPAGHVTLRVLAQAHQPFEEELRLIPGELELTYELEPVGGVDFYFYDGLVRCPLNLLEAEVEATSAEGDGEIYEIWIRSITFSDPGTYRVSFSKIPGYLPVETTVVVPEIGRVTHDVHLIRE